MLRVLAALMLFAVPAAQAAEIGPLTAPLAPVAGAAVVSIGGTALTLAAIESLPLRQSRMANPWSPQGATWTGIRLADLLAAHGLGGREITLRARDNYTIRLKPEQIVDDEPLLATRMDGMPLDPTATGPLMLLWPAQAEQVMAKTASEANWIWGIVEIKAAP